MFPVPQPQCVFSEKKLQENFLHGLSKLDWYFDVIGTLGTLSKDAFRVRIKNKNKRKK